MVSNDNKTFVTPVHVHIELEFLYMHTRVYDHSMKLQSFDTQSVHDFDYASPMKQWSFSNIEGAKAFIWPSAYTLIPNSLYSSNNKEDFIKLSHGNLEQLILKDEKLSIVDNTIVYGVHPSQQLAALTLYPGVSIHCAVGKLIDYSLHKMSDGICVRLLEKHMYVCCIKNKQLQLCNKYALSNDTDILYFISLINQKHFSSPADIHIIGKSNKELKQLLAKYHTKLHYFNSDILFSDNMKVV